MDTQTLPKPEELVFDPKVYLIDIKNPTLWPNYVYDFFHAGYDQRIRRALVSFGVGVFAYLIGLSIAATFGFVGTYVTTPAIYILIGSLIFGFGRERWLTLEIMQRVRIIREVFIVPDTVFVKEMTILKQRVGAIRLVIAITLAVLIVAMLAVYKVYYAPTLFENIHLSALEPTTFCPIWFNGTNLLGKMLIIDWYLGLAVIYIIPVFYATIVTVLELIRIMSKWSVVPIPAFVATRLRPGAEFFFVGASYYALSILALVSLYGLQVTPLSLVIISSFVVIGILSVLGPYNLLRHLVVRSRNQLASAIGAEYYGRIYPAGIDGVEKVDINANEELLKLQELMQAANETSGTVYPVDLLISALLSQGLPFLGFIAGTLFAHG